jgi:hypothetical protein
LTKYAQNDKISSMSMSAVSTPILNITPPPPDRLGHKQQLNNAFSNKMDNILIFLQATYAKAIPLFWWRGDRGCMLKDFIWGPVGRPKAPHGGGTFARKPL